MDRAISSNEINILDWLLDHALLGVPAYRYHTPYAGTDAISSTCRAGRQTDEIRRQHARNRFDVVDAGDSFPPNGIRKSLNNPARCDTSLWIDAVRIQMSYATTNVLQLAD